MTNLILLLAIIGTDTSHSVEPEPVRSDQLELNHYYDNLGRHIYSQIITRKWNSDAGRYVPTDWALVKKWRVLRKEGGVWKFYFSVNTKHGVIMRVMQAKDLYETWTQHDPFRTDQYIEDCFDE